MLEGTLPFDHKSLNVLFQQIKEAKFEFRRTTCLGARDLVNRMLQPNPLKRISLEDIKSHPWFTVKLEDYLFNYRLFHCGDHVKMDNEIKQKVLTLDIPLERTDDKYISKYRIDIF